MIVVRTFSFSFYVLLKLLRATYIIENYSFITLQITAVGPAIQGTNNYRSGLNHQYLLSIEELKNLGLAVSHHKEELRKQNLQYSNKKKECESKDAVCKAIKHDYDKYCRKGLFKAPVFNEEICKKLQDSLQDCLSQLQALNTELRGLQSSIASAKLNLDFSESRYLRAEKKCSKLESSLRHTNGQLSVITTPSLLSVPFDSIGTQHTEELQLLVTQLSSELEECLSLLAFLSIRLAEKEMQREGLSDSISKTRKKRMVKAASESALLDSLHLQESYLGLKATLLEIEVKCRRLSSDIQTATQRLEKSKTSHETQETMMRRLGRSILSFRDRFLRTFRRRR